MRKTVDIKEIKPNSDNPRIIKDNKFQDLVNSIKNFPQMLDKRPLVVDEDMVVLGGNMRLKALQKAGIKEVPIDIAEGWTEEQKREFIIKDNLSFGEWDWDVLGNEWSAEKLKDWGMDVWFEDEVDYSILDELDVSEDVEKMNEGTRKAIILEYDLKLFEKTKPLYDKLKNDGVDLPKIFYEALKKIN